MHAPQPSAKRAETVSPPPSSSPPTQPVWGVLLSCVPPTTDNGLLSYAQARFAAPAHAALPLGDATAAEALLTSPGDAWLWRHVPPKLRHHYFPSALSLTTAGGKNMEGEQQSAYATLRLLIPLCSTEHGGVTVGRLASNDVALVTNPCVSSVHCALSLQPRSSRREGESVGVDAETQRAAEDAAAAVDRAVAQHLGQPLRVATAAAAAADKNDDDARSARDAQAKTDESRATAAAVAVNAAGPPQVLLSGYSRNECLVNGHHVGRGTSTQLHNGDLVELLNAGRRHRADYNLSFRFFTAEGFVEWVSKEAATKAEEKTEGEKEDNTSISVGKSPLKTSDTPSTQQQQQHRRAQTLARRRALLCRAQWNVEAQVRRMYAHRVDEYYVLDRATPLGEGSFGVVYRAALRHDSTCSNSQLPSSLAAVAAKALAGVAASRAWDQELFTTAAACTWTANASLEAQLAEAYVREKEQRAPATVQRAAAAPSSASSASSKNLTHPFAVKVIRKQRMLLDVLHQQQQQQRQDDTSDAAAVRCDTPTTTTSAPLPMSAAEAAIIEQLALLETQPDDLAEQRREEWTAGALACLRCNDAASLANASPLLLSYNSQEVDTMALDAAMAVADQSGVHARQHQQRREQRRDELLRYLPDALRRAYEKEVQHRRRQQCEINILLAVRHPNVTTLYEVFDQPDQLALVMEQATGGEMLTLMQPYARRGRRRSAALKHRREDDGSRRARTAAPQPDEETREEEEKTAECEDIDLVGSGGPMPEYLVKIIIVQVLEAVLYLHTMGIIHRDLKLENLMLHRPCDRYAMNALQLQMLLHELRDYEHAHRRSAHAAEAAGGCHTASGVPRAPPGRMVEEREFSNPLSVLHTVHIPRALWPVVKVTDFGLSRVLDQLQTRPVSTNASDTLHGVAQRAAGDGGDAVPERLRLIYARNDATTSCGTPIYAAPEVVKPSLRPDRLGYSAAVDMYSVGVIAYALLTNKAPFASRRHPRRPNGPPVVDYDAPLNFQRRRRRAAPETSAEAPLLPSSSSAVAALTTTCAEEPTACLPPLAIVESVRVPLPPAPPPVTGGENAAATATQTAHAQRWRHHAEAFAARVRRAEGERAESCAANRTSGSQPPPSLFDTTVQQLRRALSHYGDGCAFHHEEVDLDRLVYAATEAATCVTGGQGENASSSHGRVVGADGAVSDVALPPISALGASFLRGLLEKYPSQRLTAYEALQHPWLRECVAPAASSAAP